MVLTEKYGLWKIPVFLRPIHHNHAVTGYTSSEHEYDKRHRRSQKKTIFNYQIHTQCVCILSLRFNEGKCIGRRTVVGVHGKNGVVETECRKPSDSAGTHTCAVRILTYPSSRVKMRNHIIEWIRQQSVLTHIKKITLLVKFVHKIYTRK